jgi:murein DD-endopeptidase MepM/ murein hydrolase activator NlpD
VNRRQHSICLGLVLVGLLFTFPHLPTQAAKLVKADEVTLPTTPTGMADLKGKQGEILYLMLSAEGCPLSVTGTFRNRRIPFFPVRDGVFAALVGIDMADDTTVGQLSAEVEYGDRVEDRHFRILVLPEKFTVQHLDKLPKEQVDPDAAALRRIALEQERVRNIFASLTSHRLWTQSFLPPVEGTPTGGFGRKRILNGQPRNQHSGEDIAAPLGTPVKATNAGVVRMVDDHFFSGLGVILDHGLGLYTMYFHLDSAKVKEGERVERGQIIGTVGKSGRALGPHLHWGAWLNGSRVNPFSLTQVPIESNTP